MSPENRKNKLWVGHPYLYDIFGKSDVAVKFIGRISWWYSISLRSGKDGTFFKSHDEWYDEIRLNKASMWVHIRKFKSLGILNTTPHTERKNTLIYDLDIDACNKYIEKRCKEIYGDDFDGDLVMLAHQGAVLGGAAQLAKPPSIKKNMTPTDQMSKIAMVGNYKLENHPTIVAEAIKKFEKYDLKNDAEAMCKDADQIASMDKYISKYGVSGLDATLQEIKKTNDSTYKTKINTPKDLWSKYQKWHSDVKRDKNDAKSKTRVVH